MIYRNRAHHSCVRGSFRASFPPVLPTACASPPGCTQGAGKIPDLCAQSLRANCSKSMTAQTRVLSLGRRRQLRRCSTERGGSARTWLFVLPWLLVLPCWDGPTSHSPGEQVTRGVGRSCPVTSPAPSLLKRRRLNQCTFAFVANAVLVQSVRLWARNPSNLLLFLSSLGLQSKT